MYTARLGTLLTPKNPGCSLEYQRVRKYRLQTLFPKMVNPPKRVRLIRWKNSLNSYEDLTTKIMLQPKPLTFTLETIILHQVMSMK